MWMMKQWCAVPIALVTSATIISPALSQPISIAPSSAPVQMTGKSGGPQKDNSCAGFIAAAPNHVIQVTEDADLRFSLQGSGQSALLIRSATGQNFCVPADPFSNGKVEIPGRWHKGQYSVFVGDRANESHTYTLSISGS
jgi:hypothetical protein